MKLEFSQQFFEKYSHIKFHENPSSGSRVVPHGQTEGWREGGREGGREGRTDITKLIFAFRKFANAPKNEGRVQLRRPGIDANIMLKLT
jgi:hypothetical protein